MAKRPRQIPAYEYYVIHTLGWSLELTNITLTLNSRSIYYEKDKKCNFETRYCPSNHALKATVIWKPNDYFRIFDVGRSNARKEKIQKYYFIEKLTTNKTNSGHKYKAQMYTRIFQDHIYMLNRPFVVLKWSIDHSTNIMKVALKMLHNIRILLSNLKKVLILPQAYLTKNSMTFRWQYPKEYRN